MRSTCILPCVGSDRTPVSALTLVPSSLTGVNGLQYWAQCQLHSALKKPEILPWLEALQAFV